MIEVAHDLWTYPGADIRVITTNGSIKNDGSAVMGRGCAAEAKKKFPGIDRYLGMLLDVSGNHVYPLVQDAYGGHRYELYSFPVKHEWHETASLKLIRRSAIELAHMAAIYRIDKPARPLTIVLPRPGCGSGQREWKEVKRVIRPYLKVPRVRFVVVTQPGKSRGTVDA